ncbi:MAG: MFS transporter [Bacteroidales bacterium]|jgi:MFS family permease|nr:MFS transporter [Bacteroidales bacterium]
MVQTFEKNIQYYKFCFYGFLKNLRFFEPFLILFFLEKGLSYLEIGTLYALREILINITEIPSGVVADSLGRKRTMIFSFFFYIVSFILFFTSQEYVYFMLAMLFYALGDGFRTGTHKAMIFEYLALKGWENQRVYYYGHTRSWSQMGSAISSILAASVVFYSGNYQSIFIYSTIPYILDMLLISTYPKVLDGETSKLQFKAVKIKFISITRDFIYSFKKVRIVKAIANLSVHSGYHKAIKDYLQPIVQSFALSIPMLLALQDKQRTAVIMGAVYFIIYLLTSLASKNSGRFTEKLKSMPRALNITLYLGFFLAMLSGLFYHYSLYLLSILFYVGIYIIENLRNPIGVAYVSELYQPKILATALSANSQAKSLFAAVLAPVLGYLADRYSVGIALTGVALILSLSGIFFLAKKSTKQPDNKD